MVGLQGFCLAPCVPKPLELFRFFFFTYFFRHVRVTHFSAICVPLMLLPPGAFHLFCCPYVRSTHFSAAMCVLPSCRHARVTHSSALCVPLWPSCYVPALYALDDRRCHGLILHAFTPVTGVMVSELTEVKAVEVDDAPQLEG